MTAPPSEPGPPGRANAPTLTDAVRPGLAGVVEKGHIGQAVPVIHVAASLKDLGTPRERRLQHDGRGRHLKRCGRPGACLTGTSSQQNVERTGFPEDRFESRAQQ